LGEGMDMILYPIESQEDLNNYIRKLPLKNKCGLVIDRPIQLCSVNLVCPYKGKDEYPYLGTRKRECKREEILRQKKLLG
jgi:hypothetical protein